MRPPEPTSYNVYRSGSHGRAAEGKTPIGSTTSPPFTDSGLTSGPPTLYYYKVAAVNGGTVSPQSAETASPTPPRTSPGSGAVAGVSANGGLVFYGADGLGGGFDWFNATPAMCTGCPDWFPQWLNAQMGALAPGGAVVDMAYADEATLTFSNVVVATAGLYNVDFRYAFGSGLFPLVTNREMGLLVNGTVVTNHQRFPITGSFATYQHAFTQVHLNAGQNTLTQFAVTDHGISRVDEITVTAASASLPSDPTNLTGIAGSGQVALSWTASSGATAYNVYRGTAFDGEATTPIATVTSPSYTDKSVTNGTLYFYVVAATNGVGISGDTNQITMTPMAAGGTSGPVSIDCGGGATPAVRRRRGLRQRGRVELHHPRHQHEQLADGARSGPVRVADESARPDDLPGGRLRARLEPERHAVLRRALLDGRRKAHVRRDHQRQQGPGRLRHLRRRGRAVHRRPAYVHDDRQRRAARSWRWSSSLRASTTPW